MIYGIGIDIIEIERVHAAMDNPRFALRVFTETERNYLCSRSPASAAGLWAAKEAIAKALGTGFRGFTLQDIEIAHDTLGAPQVLLHRGALTRLSQTSGSHVLLSLSHHNASAVAFALVQ